MEFTTQAELLEHLGKNPNDRRLVQRMVLRWEVVRENGVYVLVDKDEEIKNLRERIFFLENECSKNTTNDLEKELSEAKAQWEYYEKLYNEVYEDREYRLEKAFNWIKQRVKWVSWEEFKEWVMDDEEN